MNSYYINILKSELLSTSITTLYLFWRLILAALIISLLYEFILPSIKTVVISCRLAFGRAKKDCVKKIHSKENSDAGRIRRIFYSITRPVRIAFCLPKCYLIHYARLKLSIRRKIRFNAHIINKNRNIVFRFISKYYMHALLAAAILFVIYFILSRSVPVV